MNLQQHKQKLLKNSPAFKKEYESFDLAFEVGQMILEARSVKGITQKQLAQMIDTKQSGIARAESGKFLPSLSFLDKIAKALKTHLVVRFGFMTSYANDKQTATVAEKRVYIHGADEKNIISFDDSSSERYAPSYSYQFIS